jgi:hypothetical protein
MRPGVHATPRPYGRAGAGQASRHWRRRRPRRYSGCIPPAQGPCSARPRAMYPRSHRLPPGRRLRGGGTGYRGPGGDRQGPLYDRCIACQHGHAHHVMAESSWRNCHGRNFAWLVATTTGHTSFAVDDATGSGAPGVQSPRWLQPACNQKQTERHMCRPFNQRVITEASAWTRRTPAATFFTGGENSRDSFLERKG